MMQRSLRQSVALGVAALLMVAISPALASAAVGYGLESVSAEETTSQAGMHPDFTTQFTLNHETTESGNLVLTQALKDLKIELPYGLSGNPLNAPRCSTGQFRTLYGGCDTDSQVGTAEVRLEESAGSALRPLFNLEAPPNMVARLGFYALVKPVFIDIRVAAADDYRLVASVTGSDATKAVVSAKTTIWGVPADSSHDEQRRTGYESAVCPGNDACLVGGKRESGLDPLPFVNNPSACGPQSIRVTVTSYQVPGLTSSKEGGLPPIADCDVVPFQPSLQVQPTSRRAGAPTGLKAVLHIPQTNSIGLPASSALRAAKVVLPAGMTIASSGAAGLDACSASQVGFGEELEAACPEAAKIGAATFTSPALPEAIHGEIYQRTPEPGHLFRLWLVSDDFGIHLKLPGELEADPQTGQLTAEFADTPQLPVEEMALEFKGGPNALLKNPDTCGTYATKFELTPWASSPSVAGEALMTLDEGCEQGGFAPSLDVGVTNPVAGTFSPLVATLTRQDGEDNLSAIEMTLPKGELAKLRGVPLCPEDAAATGGCPDGSQIGSIALATGAGSEPLWIPQPGKAPTAVYLAGPYKGAPYSAVFRVPAQAGPFDLGTVAVRGGIYVNPNTAQVTVKSDVMPQMLEGIPILYRKLHVNIDRDRFAVNPTNCREMTVESTVTGAHGTSAHPATRFQVGACARLKFAPRLALKLKGGTKRADYPALVATLRTRPGEANLRKVVVALPHSEFLAQEHLDTICTRVRFVAGNCPAGSVYGRATAVSPLLDKPLTGPVYLRASDHPLPDLVVALHGQIDVNLVGRIDSVNEGIQTTFAGIPDAAVSKFVLRMKGGSKSLLTNSRDICRGKNHANVEMKGQNGRILAGRVLLRAECGS